ncbi:MAG TPA: Rrf2 family transcriptional regulator [Cyclobacteriaceae bacterium]
MFSRACKYAIKIMIYVAGNEKEERHTGLKEISMAIGSPEAFSAKILQQLVKSKLLESYKGPFGGFELMKNREIRLADIHTAIDGDQLVEECILELQSCSSKNPCPLHDRFMLIRSHLKETMLSTDIRDEKLHKDLSKLNG